MALSSQNSVSPPSVPSEDSQGRTYTLYTDSSVNATGEDGFQEDVSEPPRQQDAGSDVDVDTDTAANRGEEVSQSTNVREIREESNYGDDEKGGSGVETDSVDYGDGESEILRESARDGSVSPSYSSLRVEPDLEDSQSHLRLEEIFEGNGSAMESEVDLASLSEPFAVSELELIERALQGLQNNHKNLRQEFSASAEGEADDIRYDREPPSPGYSGDVSGVSRLLKKVQAVREQKRDALVTGRRDNNGSPRPRSISTVGEQDIDFDDMRQVIQATSRAAFSAAKAAETMVKSMDRNSQAIEELCRSLTCTSTEGKSLKQNEEETAVENHGDINSGLMKLQQSELDIELRQAEITKNLTKQHRITHWVLGFIIVSSLAWRIGVVKFVRRVNAAVTNPLQGISGVFDNFRGDKSKDKQIEKNDNGLTLPTLLPGSSVLPAESDYDKDGELPFNLGKILPHTATTDTEIHPEQIHGSEQHTDGFFNLGKIFPGKEGTTDAEE